MFNLSVTTRHETAKIGKWSKELPERERTHCSVTSRWIQLEKARADIYYTIHKSQIHAKGKVSDIGKYFV